jgi:predicted transcriptional regulator
MNEPLKQEVMNAISKLPDDINDIEEIMYQLYVIDKIRKGRAASEQGRTITSENLKSEIDAW